MKKTICLMLLAGLVFLPAAAEEYKVKKTEVIQKNLAFAGPGGTGEILVDNIFGSITVEGYGGSDVKLTIRKTIKARSQEILERAQREVKLDIGTEGRAIDMYVDGPFRDRDEDGRNDWRNPGYQVLYDFDIKVPRRTDLSLKTVNGDLDVYFTDNLSADFRLKTFHGDMLSDFPVKYLPLKAAPKGERKGGKYVYKGNRFVGVQTGNGGPEMTMDTLNGDILIHKR